MKKIAYTLMIMAFVVTLNSCQDDEISQQIENTQSGEGILFSTELSENASTRTVYDDKPTGEGSDAYYRVSWEKDGSDQIAIYCPQASVNNGGNQLVTYSITPQDDNPTVSKSVTSSGTGLKWGEENEHHFYAFYPANAVKGTEDGKIQGTVPALQNVTKWNIQDNEKGGKTYYGVANTDYAYMWAYGSANRATMGDDEPVNLLFHPWMTILEIEINGPASGTKKVSNINVTAIEGEQTVLTGDFICNMQPVEENPNANPTYEVVEGQTAVRNNISISGDNPDTNESIELGPNDKMVVRAFLLPVDDDKQDSRKIQIRVATLNGAIQTRTLGATEEHGYEGSIVPHKVNKVILPPLIDTGTNYWMSSLDENIYLSELSIPGSKFSYLTPANTNGRAAFQGVDIEQQFLDGVRAFIVQVGANVTYDRNGEAITNATMPIFCGGGDNLENAVKLIANGLATAQDKLGEKNHECAVVMITYAGNEEVYTNYGREGGKERVWMDALEYKLNQLKSSTEYRVYTEEVLSTTTLKDVAGKIIFKVNTSSDDQNSYLDPDAKLPALFSRWNKAQGDVDLRWGTSNPNTLTDLHWYYQEATHVGNSTEITATNKLQFVKDVFSESIAKYQENGLGYWFMNDCGGTFQFEVSGAQSFSGNENFDKNYGDGDANTENVIALTRWLNPHVRAALQRRTANASTGLVFFNYADKQDNSGKLYGTDELIQTVIDNNFKFNLRKAGN